MLISAFFQEQFKGVIRFLDKGVSSHNPFSKFQYHFKVGAQNEQKMIIFNEQNLIISIL